MWGHTRGRAISPHLQGESKKHIVHVFLEGKKRSKNVIPHNYLKVV